ncbi:hypothetical protein ACVWXX_000101 [Bacillus toyonensis]
MEFNLFAECIYVFIRQIYNNTISHENAILYVNVRALL